MILKKWEELPEEMKTESVRKYYDRIKKKKCSLIIKRAFDVIVSGVMLLLLSPLFLMLAIAIKLDSKGPVFFRQIRVTQYNRTFKIFKFRSMIQGADKGSQVTVSGDSRITKVGAFIRKYRLDEICQLIDVFRGTMTFVGTRPEVPKYTAHYTDEMMATLLLPAGVTSLASIYYKDEAELLNGAEDIDRVYLEQILPQKMRYNLSGTKQFSLLSDINIMLKTVLTVFGKGYSKEDKIEEKEQVEI